MKSSTDRSVKPVAVSGRRGRNTGASVPADTPPSPGHKGGNSYDGIHRRQKERFELTFSPFMMIQSLDPMHLSISSRGSNLAAIVYSAHAEGLSTHSVSFAHRTTCLASFGRGRHRCQGAQPWILCTPRIWFNRVSIDITKL